MPVILRAPSQANELAEKLRQRIQSEHLADGTFFMTEAQLASEYDVSHTVAREAVGRLKALGILEGRKRKGLYIRHPDPLALLSDSLPSLVASPDDWRELAQLRYALEVGAIELAIREATEEQLEGLAEVMQEMELALREDTQAPQAIALDLEFHARLLRMTGSRLIAGMQQVLVQFFQIAPHSEKSAASAERIIWEHRELLAAIRARDVERARAMIRVQYQSTLQIPDSDRAG